MGCTQDQAVWVWVLARVAVFCFWARRFLSQCLKSRDKCQPCKPCGLVDRVEFLLKLFASVTCDIPFQWQIQMAYWLLFIDHNYGQREWYCFLVSEKSGIMCRVTLRRFVFVLKLHKYTVFVSINDLVVFILLHAYRVLMMKYLLNGTWNRNLRKGGENGKKNIPALKL